MGVPQRSVDQSLFQGSVALYTAMQKSKKQKLPQRKKKKMDLCSNQGGVITDSVVDRTGVWASDNGSSSDVFNSTCSWALLAIETASWVFAAYRSPAELPTLSVITPKCEYY